MATVYELTEPYVSTYVAVPPTAVGVCRVCHGPTTRDLSGEFYVTCWSCRETTRGVSRPTRLVVPVSLTHKHESQWYAVLKDYKADWQPEEIRNDYAQRVCATLWRFLDQHGGCIERAAGEDWDTLTVVPSTRRQGPHALEHAIRRSSELGAQLAPLLTRGPGELDHQRASDDGYVAGADAAGRRVLVVDDTFTTGARIQSAASALTLAGARVIAAVPLGRIVNTGDTRFPERDEFWQRQRRVGFDFNRCPLEE